MRGSQTLTRIGLGLALVLSLDAAAGFPVSRGIVGGGVLGEGDKMGDVDTASGSDGASSFLVPETAVKPATTLRSAKRLTTEGWCPNGQLTGRIQAGAGVISGVRSALGGDDVRLARGITVYDLDGNPLKSWDTVGEILQDPGVRVVPDQVVCVRERSR